MPEVCPGVTPFSSVCRHGPPRRPSKTNARFHVHTSTQDWVEAYQHPVVAAAARADGVDPGVEMVRLISDLRAYGRRVNPGFVVIQQNAAELLQVGGWGGCLGG